MLTVLCLDVPLTAPDDPRWPRALSRRLERAQLIASIEDDSAVPAATPWEAWLAARFGLARASDVAPWQRLSFPSGALSPEPPSLQPQLLTVVPACLHAGIDHLVLQGPQALAVGEDEARELIAAANAHLADDQARLHFISPSCWVLDTTRSLDLVLHSSFVAHGRNVDAYMPQGPQARVLRRLLNEMQMLWHTHPVNEARRASGLAPINTIWVEGAVVPGRLARPFDAVHADAACIRGLAIGHGLQAANVGTAGQFEYRPADTGHGLLALSGAGALERLQQIVLQQPAGIIELVLTDDRRARTVRLAPRDGLRFWRRTRWHGQATP